MSEPLAIESSLDLTHHRVRSLIQTLTLASPPHGTCPPAHRQIHPGRTLLRGGT